MTRLSIATLSLLLAPSAHADNGSLSTFIDGQFYSELTKMCAAEFEHEKDRYESTFARWERRKDTEISEAKETIFGIAEEEGTNMFPEIESRSREEASKFSSLEGEEKVLVCQRLLSALESE